MEVRYQRLISHPELGIKIMGDHMESFLFLQKRCNRIQRLLHLVGEDLFIDPDGISDPIELESYQPNQGKAH